MAKKLDLNKTVYELTQEYPELIEIMAGLGFTEIIKKPMLHSVGKIMTIPKGAKMKNISMMDVVTTLMGKGFELVGEMPDMSSAPQAGAEKTNVNNPPASRTEQLKTYLKRLGEGEKLETVRADFVREFSDVEASEIMQAEQELMKEGTPLSEVQRLCDVHSALFHGATTEEKIANAEKEVEASLLRKKAHEELAKRDSFPKKDYTDSLTVDDLVALTLETGKFGVDGMALLDSANTGAYGNPEITEVNIGVRNNPGILISGHDLKDLEQLLEQTKGTGVDVYTHSEMLPAH